MTATMDRRSPRRWAVLAASVATAAALLTACSGGGAGDQAADGAQSEVGSAGGDGAAADGGVAAPGDVGPGDADAAESERQVVQTGVLRLTVEDPRTAADAVVDLAERSGGRVDSRSEHAASQERAGSAALTIRVPADEVSATVDALRELGRIDEIDLDAQDVTAAAQDLDARIRGLELSVTRMSDLLARTTTTEDVVAAEDALTERQTRLEELQSQRARLADAVALSTLTVELVGPGAVPAASPGPTSFLGGLAVGWQAFVVTLRGLLVVLGVLLPWLAFTGAVTAGVVAAVRWRRRRRGPRPGPVGPGGPPWAVAPAGPAPAGPAPAGPPAAATHAAGGETPHPTADTTP
ncbi:DUF4349 domain-containing protein [Cellulomonas sp. H30R-01]|uniref:DUF4349 domain-containing protein n=1 Tax=Cellulomonas sp. H30R-01 TaxID=2704467 RepID=UPI00138B5831|nr:DUF4349 domain-containing protein [Cellulomonas sp. H30R-01]QHT56405.1 DUF4349 domain-containing protein [Cellulomonas sp. H30R-01]